jgi:uncharacterized membrane protein
MTPELGADFAGGNRVTGLHYLLVLIAATAAAAVGIHHWLGMPWYESLMGGLLVGVLVLVIAFISWPQWMTEWREFRNSRRR